jgi:hypothetical protein
MVIAYPADRPVQPQFFGFPLPHPPDHASPLTDSTRHLCCAPYVDSDFAGEVIREVVEDEHRAVPPTLDADFDHDPIVRHCFRARRLLLGRDVLLTLLVVLGLLTTPVSTLLWLTVGVWVLLARTRTVRAMPWLGRARLLVWVAVHGIVVSCVGGILPYVLVLIMALAANPAGTTGFNGPYDDTSGGLASGLSSSLVSYGALLAPFVLAILALTVVVLFRNRAYGILAHELSPQSRTELPKLPNNRVAQRMAWVSAAQHGNITVYSADPFLGAGSIARQWSFAMPLEPEEGRRGGPSQRVAIDPVRLNQVLRDRLLRLRDPDMPESERVPGLYLMPHLVADGTRRQRDVLLEPSGQTPYTVASPAAIEAIIRHPQGGLRYYQRAIIGAHGKSVRDAYDQEVVPAQDQQLVVSVFVHVAVEGGMLYTEFVATVLPPPRAEYHLPDALHTSSERIFTRALRDAVRTWPADCAAAPWRMARSWRRIVTTGRRMDRADRASREYRVYDYGARLSVRELGAEREPTTYLQSLDADKYAKIAERAITDALLGHLEEQGVNTAEFAMRVNFVQNIGAQTLNNMFDMAGSTFSGPTAFGSGATATTVATGS